MQQMMNWLEFKELSFREKVNVVYQEGDFVTAIRYYGYKVNLYLLEDFYVEVFYNHKWDRIEKVDFLQRKHSRMKFYYDQIRLPEYIK